MYSYKGGCAIRFTFLFAYLRSEGLGKPAETPLTLEMSCLCGCNATRIGATTLTQLVCVVIAAEMVC